LKKIVLMKDYLKQYVWSMLFLLCGGTAWAQGDYNPVNPPDPQMLYKVVALATDGHYTSGSGSYAVGTQVTINTSASSTGFDFKHWTKNGVFYTNNKSFTYTVEAANVRFQAVYDFNPTNPQDPQTISEYRLYLVPDPVEACSFNRTSGQKCSAGTNPTVTAYGNQGFVFQGWYDGDTKISESTTLNTFTMPNINTTLTARYVFSPVSPAEPETSYALGDVNRDRELNVTDVIGLTNYIMNPDGSIDTFLYDTNKDGEVNVTDIIRLVNKIMNNQ